MVMISMRSLAATALSALPLLASVNGKLDRSPHHLHIRDASTQMSGGKNNEGEVSPSREENE